MMNGSRMKARVKALNLKLRFRSRASHSPSASLKIVVISVYQTVFATTRWKIGSVASVREIVQPDEVARHADPGIGNRQQDPADERIGDEKPEQDQRRKDQQKREIALVLERPPARFRAGPPGEPGAPSSPCRTP